MRIPFAVSTPTGKHAISLPPVTPSAPVETPLSGSANRSFRFQSSPPPIPDNQRRVRSVLAKRDLSDFRKSKPKGAAPLLCPSLPPARSGRSCCGHPARSIGIRGAHEKSMLSGTAPAIDPTEGYVPVWTLRVHRAGRCTAPTGHHRPSDRAGIALRVRRIAVRSLRNGPAGNRWQGSCRETDVSHRGMPGTTARLTGPATSPSSVVPLHVPPEPP